MSAVVSLNTHAPAPGVDEPCWNCGGTSFTSNKSGHHMRKQTICSTCYEPQEEDESFYDDDDMW